jgi:hypothetical protein
MQPPTVRTQANKYPVTATVENLMRYLTRTWTIPKYFMTTSRIHAPTRGAHFRFRTIALYGRGFVNRYGINKLRMGCLYTKFCGQTKHALRVKICSTFTVVTFVNGTILTLSSNMGIKSASASTFGLESSGTCRWSLPATCQAGSSTISWEPFRRGCLKMCL